MKKKSPQFIIKNRETTLADVMGWWSYIGEDPSHYIFEAVYECYQDCQDICTCPRVVLKKKDGK